MKKDKSGDDIPASQRIDAYIADLDDWRGDLLARIRDIFHDSDDEIIEEWKWMGSPVWSHTGIIAVGNAHKGKVKLTFQQGAHLDDQHNLFNAGLGGKQWRAIDYFEEDELDDAALKDLIITAIKYNISKNKK